MSAVATYLLSVLLLPAQAPQKPQPKQEPCTLEGVVLAADSGAPLKKAWVFAYDFEDREQSKGAMTDATGRFTITGLDPGRYRLQATRTGYVTQEYEQKEPGQPGTIVTLAPGQHLRDLSFRLLRAAAVFGHIYDEDGEPMERARVSVLHYAYFRGKRQLMPRGFVTTDDLGYYRIFGLPPGKYFVSAMYRPSRFGGEGPETAYAAAFYPGTTDPAGATLITLRAGDDYGGVDFAVQLTRGVTVSGRVFNAVLGQPGRGAHIMLMPRARLVFEPLFSNPQIFADERTGDFKLTGIAPGSYYLTAITDSEGKQHSVRITLDVGDSDIEGLNVTIHRGVELSGRVRIEGSVDISGVQVVLQPRDQQIGFGMEGGRVNSDGTFTLSNVPDGSCLVNVWNLPGSAYLKAVRAGGEDVLLKGIEISGGQSPGPLELVISGNPGTFEGTVLKDMNPASGATVALVPDDPELRKDQRWFKEGSTDQNGKFRLGGVRPGDYKAYAWEKLERGAYADPDFLRRYESRGTAVHVEEGGVQSVKLELIPAEGSAE